ncbi:MAG: type II secretion system protein N [Phycisphaerales bacterium]
MNEKRVIKVVWLIKASLVVALAYGGFRAITDHLHVAAFDPGSAVGEEQTPDAGPPQTDAAAPADYEGILQSNLFAGADSATDSRRSQVLDSMPSAEELGLRLVGVIAGGPAISRANIQDVKAKTTGVYRIGDTVASATIEAIQHDAVVLRHEGRQLILRLRTGTAGAEPQPAAPADPQNEKAPAQDKQATLPPVKADYVAEVFRKATIEPYVKNDKTEGLRITGLDKIPIAEMFGLRDGDVIRSVNGQQLTSKQKAFQVLMKARTQSKVDIELLRNGKSKDLSFGL